MFAIPNCGASTPTGKTGLILWASRQSAGRSSASDEGKLGSASIENRMLDDAASLLDQVDITIVSDHPSDNFSGIARSNRDHMLTVLERARNSAR